MARIPKFSSAAPSFSEIYLLTEEYATPEVVRALHTMADQLSAYLAELRAATAFVGSAQDALIESASFVDGAQIGSLVYRKGQKWSPAVNSTDNTWAYAVAHVVGGSEASVQYSGRAQVLVSGDCDPNDTLFLSDTPGYATTTRPALTTAGLHQEVGMALSKPVNGVADALLAFRIEPERINV